VKHVRFHRKDNGKNNIVLIGMPGSGKSTIGRALARMMNLGFLDCDEYIQRVEGLTLQQLIDRRGVAGFRKVEEARILELNLRNHVIAPGGSVVYSPKAIAHLKASSLFVFLHLAVEDLKRRLNNASQRGIVGLKTKSLNQLFQERLPLYLQYADVTIDCTGKPKNAIIEEIRQSLVDKRNPKT
jgi:shikimate kinase